MTAKGLMQVGNETIGQLAIQSRLGSVEERDCALFQTLPIVACDQSCAIDTSVPLTTGAVPIVREFEVIARKPVHGVRWSATKITDWLGRVWDYLNAHCSILSSPFIVSGRPST